MWLWRYLMTKWKGNPWSIPVANLGEVVPGKIYRSARPAGDALEAARALLGIRTVLDLRLRTEEEAEAAREAARAAGLEYVSVPMDDHGEVSLAELEAALGVVEDGARQPVLVHCEGGRHRTGAVVAVYRMWREGWALDRAYEEAREFGFYSAVGHGGVKRSIEAADRARPHS